MNKQEYLLNQLSQECIEVAKEISKALQFGLLDVYPQKKSYISNKQKIESELNDLMGVLDMVIKFKILDEPKILCRKGRLLKITKSLKWMEYSRNVGALKDE